MIEEQLADFFKAETRTSGRKLFAQDKVSVSGASDTFVQAFVRGTPASKVSLASDSIGSESVTVSCSCNAHKKGQMCKHIWAALLYAESKYPDFLVLKRAIERSSQQEAMSSVGADEDQLAAAEYSALDSASRAQSARQTERDARNAAYKEAAKARASEYRKEQYQKAKERAQAYKAKRSGKPIENEFSRYPEQVQRALAYFSLNGFAMDSGATRESVSLAKRKLSQVFHPDKGGTNEEMYELNQYCQVVLDFLGQ